MTPEEVLEIESALDEGFTEIAGDAMVWVDKNDNQTALIGMMEDMPTDAKSEGQGVVSGPAGWTSGGVRKLTFLKRNLAALNVTIDPSGYFLINGERWDLCEEYPVSEAIVPLVGIQNLLEVVVRRAVELNNTVPGSEFTYG